MSLRTAAGIAAAILAVGGGAAVLVSAHVADPSAGHAQATPAATHAPESPEASEQPEATGSGDTGQSAHGAAVVSAVASCKAARPSPDASPRPSPGSRGIGECVSTVASGGREGGVGDTGSGNGNSGTGGPPSHPAPHSGGH